MNNDGDVVRDWRTLTLVVLTLTVLIFIANIHTIKGMEFDNVILDLKITREEPKFTKKRLKFVAGSRARKSFWLIKSMGLSL